MNNDFDRFTQKLQLRTGDRPEFQDLIYIKRCCGYLRKLGLIRNHYQFSENFMGKNKYYFGMVLSENRLPSVDAVHNLIEQMTAIKELYEQENNMVKANYLNKLIEEGDRILIKRLYKYGL